MVRGVELRASGGGFDLHGRDCQLPFVHSRNREDGRGRFVGKLEAGLEGVYLFPADDKWHLEGHFLA